MKRIVSTICIAILLMGLAAFTGCGNNSKADAEAIDALTDLRREEMNLSAELCTQEILSALYGGKGALEDLDCSRYAEKMEEYDELLKYSDLHIWMALEGMAGEVNSIASDTMTISDEDYEALVKAFYALDSEAQSKVLRHMFTDTGAREHRTITLEFDYAPTGETAENGADITKYQATETKDIDIEIYEIDPLTIEFK